MRELPRSLALLRSFNWSKPLRQKDRHIRTTRTAQVKTQGLPS